MHRMRSAMPNSGVKKRMCNISKSSATEDEGERRRGPWTLEEDTLLTHYIARHGEGRWNMLAKYAGLKRNGKSCRLRWLNYLKPDIKRGNLTPQEQLLILELHSKWGNKWSKIAQHLPGRTDNEIKNYWRTRVQRQARQMNIESNSKRFIDAVRCFWMPRLLQKVEQASFSSSPTLETIPDSQTHPLTSSASSFSSLSPNFTLANNSSSPPSFPQESSKSAYFSNLENEHYSSCSVAASPASADLSADSMTMISSQVLENSQASASSSLLDDTALYDNHLTLSDGYYVESNGYDMDGFNAAGSMSEIGTFHDSQSNYQMAQGNWVFDDDIAADALWNMDDIWQFRL